MVGCHWESSEALQQPQQLPVEEDVREEKLVKSSLTTTKGLFSSMINIYDQIHTKHLGENRLEEAPADRILKDLRFKVLRNIGQGGFGQVKLATSERYPRQVAIKVMERRLMAPDIVSKFLPRELAILNTVRHPHIIKVLDIIDMPSGEVFIVMEAAETNLYRKVRELHHVPIAQAKTWFCQLLSAVAYLHQQDIVHRDIKWENVLLTSDGQIKLTDFGFGRYSKGLHDRSETFYCTPVYAAPEVLRCDEYDPKKVDVWNLGVVLYMMVTGTSPFMKTHPKFYPRFEHKAIEYPEEITVEEPCRSLIASMLQYHPSARPSVEELEQNPWLQSALKCEINETSDRSLTEAEGSAQEKVVGTPEKPFEDLQQQQQQITAEEDREEDHVEKNSSPISNGLLSSMMIPNEQTSFINEVQEDESSGAVASQTCESMEVVGESGCCSPLCAAVKRAAKTHIIAPIIRASWAFRRRMRKLFRTKSVQQESSSASQQDAQHSAASREAPPFPSS